MTVGAEPKRYTLFAAEIALLQEMAESAARRVHCAPWTAHGVEIGAYAGDVTHWLWRALGMQKTQLIVIDPWDGTQDGAGEDVYAKWQEQLTRQQQAWYINAHYPIVWRQRSQTATPPDQLCFVFHDGDHRDLSDLPRWWDALVPGGTLAIHDVQDPGWPNVRAAVEALGPPWHEYRYVPDAADVAEYGPGLRGLAWKIKR